MAVSTDFAPPFKLIAPYFLLGIFSFVVAVLLLFGIDVTTITQTDASTIAWVHLFLLGFVMMVIFGAMAQLVPVVLEVGHFAVDLYYIIYPLLFGGTVLMVFGFSAYPMLLPFGGVVVLIALLIFIYETLLTILKVRKFNTVITSVLLANLFLLFGLGVGITLALGYAGVVVVNLDALLQAHIYAVLFGYVGVTIMGISMVLLPMFWLSHNFSWLYIKSALWLIGFGVSGVLFGSIFEIAFIVKAGYLLSLLSLLFYIYQVYLIYKTRVRIERDIYLYNLLFSYGSFVVSIALALLSFVTKKHSLFVASGYLALVGFVAFMIIAHLYKIIPFLVWYQRFSPLVGKQKVPMLADMVPKQSANFGLFFNLIGVTVTTLGLIFSYQQIFEAGVSFFVVGAIFIAKDIIYMISFKG